jgi:hypothetical protein
VLLSPPLPALLLLSTAHPALKLTVVLFNLLVELLLVEVLLSPPRAQLIRLWPKQL